MLLDGWSRGTADIQVTERYLVLLSEAKIKGYLFPMKYYTPALGDKN